MTRREKKRFVKDLIRTIKNDILVNVERMPEEWDGIELRQYIVEQFANRGVWGNGRMPLKRYRAFRNTVLVNNL